MEKHSALVILPHQKAELFLRVFRLHQICTKGVPENMNPFASLIITYLVGAAVAFIMFLILGDSRDILTELKKANWTSFVLGIVIVPSRYNLTYSNGSSMASAFNAQSDPGVVFKFLSASQQSMRSI